MTVAMAERARVIDSAGAPALDEATFIANLTDVLLGILDAPWRGPLSVSVAPTAPRHNGNGHQPRLS